VRIVWAPRALARVEEAADYIAQDRPGAAVRWVEGLFARVGLLAEAPAQGRVVPEVGREEIREIQYQRYRVIYRLESKRLVVLTVRHSRRQFDAGDLSEE
jgi:plasmid stabilization system protein ParE